LQALHRVRERFVGQRTGIINQIRAFMLERGIAVRQRLRFLRAELPGILATRSQDLLADWRRLDARIEDLSSHGRAALMFAGMRARIETTSPFPWIGISFTA
jgi:transposase